MARGLTGARSFIIVAAGPTCLKHFMVSPSIFRPSIAARCPVELTDTDGRKAAEPQVRATNIAPRAAPMASTESTVVRELHLVATWSSLNSASVPARVLRPNWKGMQGPSRAQPGGGTRRHRRVPTHGHRACAARQLSVGKATSCSVQDGSNPRKRQSGVDRTPKPVGQTAPTSEYTGCRVATGSG